MTPHEGMTDFRCAGRAAHRLASHRRGPEACRGQQCILVFPQHHRHGGGRAQVIVNALAVTGTCVDREHICKVVCGRHDQRDESKHICPRMADLSVRSHRVAWVLGITALGRDTLGTSEGMPPAAAYFQVIGVRDEDGAIEIDAQPGAWLTVDDQLELLSTKAAPPFQRCARKAGWVWGERVSTALSETSGAASTNVPAVGKSGSNVGLSNAARTN